MAIDRGGLQYGINIEGNFEQKFDAFRTSLAQARQEWRQFKTDLASVGAESRRARRELSNLTAAGKKQADASRASARAAEQQLTASRRLTAAGKQLSREKQKLAIIEERESLIAEKRAALADRSIIQQRAEAAAARAITRALEREATARELGLRAKQLGLQLSADGTRVFNAEAEAISRIAREEQKLAVARELSRRGFDAQGRAVQQGPQLSPDLRRQQEARRQLDRELESLRQGRAVEQLRAQSTEYQRLTKDTNRLRDRTRGLGDAFDRTEARANRVGFTFRRLIGIMAAFTIAREVVNQFNAMIRSAVNFNRVIEQTELGIASLLQSTGTIRDAEGQALQGAEAFAQAQRIARNQIALLRSDAQKTAGSITDLAEAFQTAVGFGLKADLDLKQIRRITQLISQAATPLGVAQNQLAEEIRSLLEGTITPRNSRIATVLNITPDDVRRAKETGQIFEFIEDKFQGIAQAGEKALDTFNAQATNASDAFTQLLGVASGGFFNELKELLRTFREEVQTEADGILQSTPEGVEALKALFDGLAQGVAAARQVVDDINFNSVEQLAGSIGETLGLAVSLAAQLLDILVDGFAPFAEGFRILGRVLSQALEGFRKLDDASGGSFSNILAAVIQFRIMVRLLIITQGLFGGLLRLSAAIRATWAATSAFILASRIRLAGMIAGMQKLLRLSKLTSKQWLIIIGAVLAAAKALESLGVLEDALESVESVLGPIFNELDNLVDRIIGFGDTAGAGVGDALGVVTQNLGTIRAEVAQILDEIEDQVRSSRQTLISGLATLGVEPEVARQIESFYQGRFRAEEQLRNLTLQRNRLLQQQADLNEQYAKNQDTILGFSKEGANEEERRLLFLRDQVTQQSSFVRGLRDRAAALRRQEQEALQGTDSASPAARAAAVKELKETRDSLLEITSKIADAERGLSSLREQFGSAASNAQELADALERDNLLIGQSIAIREGLESVEEGIQEVRKENLRIAANEILLVARQRSFAIQRETLESRLLATQNRRLAQAEISGDSNRVSQLQLEFELENRKLQLQLREIDNERTITKLQQVKKSLVETFPTDLAIQRTLERQISDELKNQNAEREKAQSELDLITARLERQRQLQEGSIIGGVGDGLNQFALENSGFQAGQSFGQTFANEVSSFLSDRLATEVANIFDPRRDSNLGDAAAALGESIGRALLDQLIAAGVADLISSISESTVDTTSSLAVAAILETASETLQKGSITLGASSAVFQTAGATSLSSAVLWETIAPQWQAIATTLLAAGLALSSAGAGGAHGGKVGYGGVQGFAGGGKAKGPGTQAPRGVDPRDRVPVWARIGEWFIKPEAGRFYGDRIMSLINSMRIDPWALQQLASAGGRMPRGRGMGFAEGGSVGGSGRTFERRDRGAELFAEEDQSPTQLVQFHDEQSMDQALAAGSRAFFRFVRRNKAETKAALE